MHKQNLRRLIIGAVAIIAIFVGWSMFRNYAKDPGDVGTVDSEGWVLAVEDTDEGYRTVVFNPDGAKTTLSGSAGRYPSGANSRYMKVRYHQKPTPIRTRQITQ